MRIGNRLLIAFALIITFSVTVGAEPPQGDRNLKILPKEISQDQLTELMKSFTRALGVKCD